MRDMWMTYHSHLILKKRKINFTEILKQTMYEI